jgi:ribosomal protein L29
MAKDKKILTGKEADKKIADLKIELLKQPQKKKSIKKEIARLFTMENAKNRKSTEKSKTKLGGKK